MVSFSTLGDAASRTLKYELLTKVCNLLGKGALNSLIVIKLIESQDGNSSSHSSLFQSRNGQ